MSKIEDFKNVDKLWEDFERKTTFIKSFFWTLFRRIKDIKWWFLHRFHPKHRYHVLKYRNVEPGWYDIDYRMLHACFDLFLDFIEKEDGLETLKYQYTYLEEEEVTYFTTQEKEEMHKRNKEIYEEAVYLYNWWTKIYPINKDEIYCNNFAYDDETEHLIRLIKLRKYFWT